MIAKVGPDALASSGNDKAMRCLIVDDETVLRTILRRVMEADGYTCLEATSGADALSILDANERQGLAPIPLVLSDMRMPEMDGSTLLRCIMSRWADTTVVMISGSADVDGAVRCLSEGALDYVTKPFHADEVRVRIAQALEKRRLLVENRAYRRALEERVVQQAHKYEELFLASLQSLADALEVKDAYTWGHSTRVARYGVAIARELGVTGAALDQIELGGRLHDIGKIGVREAVLNKEGRLNDDEYAHVMEHPVIGWRLLAPLLRDVPEALAVVRSHHERVDGLGSPDRLRGEEIPLGARIIAVADSFDAMTSGRVYRTGVSFAEAMAELRRCAGTQFDPACVAAFERVMRDDVVVRPDVMSKRNTGSLRVVA